MSTRVMLIGDSIRMYTEEKVREKLGESYDVWSPANNCMYTANTFNSLRFYLRECPAPDIIHWNNGLWDTAVYYDDGNMTPLPVYLDYLKRILRQLKKTGAKIIFATTTPTHPKKELPKDNQSRHFNSDIDRYNEAAVSLMCAEGVIINDLNRALRNDIEVYIRSDDLIHPNDAGIEKISTLIADKIKETRGN